jgi:hypothetical protein
MQDAQVLFECSSVDLTEVIYAAILRMAENNVCQYWERMHYEYTKTVFSQTVAE